MKISELLAGNKKLLSFEVFPPKTDTAFENVKAATEKIAALRPDFMSVTYGAGGGTSKYTLDIAENIKKNYNVPMLAHLTCVSSNRQFVLEKIRDIDNSCVDNVMALRGDIPAGLENADRSDWAYQHASQLIRDIRENAPRLCIGGACYPEVHPESKNQAEDIAYLKEKVEAGCDFLTTQMFFDNGIFYSFLYKILSAGISAPIIPGIMPITNAKQVDRAVKMSGSFMPRRFKTLVDKYGENPEAMKQAGIIYACDQIIDLYANGIKNVHVYSMNNPDVAEQIKHNLSHIIA